MDTQPAFEWCAQSVALIWFGKVTRESPNILHGTESVEDVEWGGRAYCRCHACCFEADVQTFTE